MFDNAEKSLKPNQTSIERPESNSNAAANFFAGLFDGAIQTPYKMD